MPTINSFGWTGTLPDGWVPADGTDITAWAKGHLKLKLKIFEVVQNQIDFEAKYPTVEQGYSPKPRPELKKIKIWVGNIDRTAGREEIIPTITIPGRVDKLYLVDVTEADSAEVTDVETSINGWERH